MRVSQSNQTGLALKLSGLPSMSISEEEPAHWKAPSLTAGSEAGSRPKSICSEDVSTLLALLCFLAPCEKITLDFLFRGATPRKRWNEQGEIEETDAICAGLVPELVTLLSDITRLSNAFHALDLSSAVLKNSDQTYTVDEAVVACVYKSLSLELHSFWKFQTLVVAYRSIPWKYIEPDIPSVGHVFLTHLKHTLQAYKDDFEHLPATTRVDLVLTLVEASRFPTIEWKRFAIAQANIAVRGLQDHYVLSRIALSESLLYRIAGDMNQATSVLEIPSQDRPSGTADQRMHSVTGQIKIQRCLNSIQVEDIYKAEELLEEWRPLGQSPSLMEEVVLFRKTMMLGRIMRFQGRFRESLVHLEKSKYLAGQHKDLYFHEDLRDLTCDLADTLRELDNPVYAEHYLRKEITWRNKNCALSSRRFLLELSLAEVLFAQGRFKEAEKLCLHIQSHSELLKFEKLRLYIILAKLHYVDSDDEGAFSYWTQALVAISKFPKEGGAATRIILMSICDILSRQGQSQQLLDQYLKELASMDKLTRQKGNGYWIAGLRHWVEYLQSTDSSSRL